MIERWQIASTGFSASSIQRTKDTAPFFFNDTATTEIYTLSLHDALPISPVRAAGHGGIGEALAHFARGIGAARSGDTVEAGAEIAALTRIEGALAGQSGYDWSRIVGIERQAVEAWVAFARSDTAGALSGARAAA